MTIFLFVLFCLACYRFTRLIVFDEITSFIRAPFHDEVAEVDEEGNEETYIVIKGNGLRAWIGKLLSCFWCTGMWVAIALYGLYILVPTILIPIIYIGAIAGTAAFLEILTQKLMD
ncbi:DUF1360 domain-containing protein [Bacillus sp. HMF5848]|uniref:DUF1360 domain-containing protein n=1 Tax=Bacillus sp. HMF5848 TaxID=2495421 RepID=UPI000F7A0D96|nr:DUF1360 domain-containing protein [Bacillus sp. HMF5848]RSK26512.1 DUF1360 domain-containing protein [Bacillus sp. HMF5848]